DGLDEMFAEIADQPGCEDFFGNAAIRPEGEYTFESNGVLNAVDARFSFTIDVKLTPACARGVAGANAVIDAATCSRFEDNLTGDGGSISGASCSLVGGGCSCKVSSVAMMLGGSTMYEVRGDQLIEDGESDPFCVAGDQLKVRTSATSGMAGTLTFQRK
ncbi:MAG TPA: hypothetical protein VK509_21895, partial [Polyangiales bacterium]|nr:hypothetical protein [Polyangiales bacterium]